VRCCLLGRLTTADSITCLLATPQREMSGWSQPFRQDRKGLPAWVADPAASPDVVVFFIVRLPESAAMADDRPVMAERTSARQ
jgi:hypothetical protein